MNAVRRLIRATRLANNRRRSFVSFEFRGWIPQLVIHEKYENGIKWGLRGLIVVGIASGAVAFRWYVGIAVGVVLAGFEQLLERAIFRYTSMFIQPLPRFSYDPDEWLGMAFSEPVEEDGPCIVGPIFRSKEYALKFLALIRAWNYGEDEDANDNIQLSIVVEDAEKYSVYLYASPERPTVSEFAETVEKEARLDKPGREHLQLLVGMIFCRMFNYSTESHFERFRQSQAIDRPILFTAAYQREDGQAQILDDPKPILKFDWKIKYRKKLTVDDMELEHGKLVIGL